MFFVAMAFLSKWLWEISLSLNGISQRKEQRRAVQENIHQSNERENKIPVYGRVSYTMVWGDVCVPS